nr:RsmB/NOP family class I SAM-dependent RNA methyltransferase [Candidatus Sigynarchaeota archaeon]
MLSARAGRKDAFHKEDEDYFMRIAIIFHVFEEKIEKKVYAPFSVEEKEKALSLLKIVLPGLNPDDVAFINRLLELDVASRMRGKAFTERCSILYSHPSFFIEILRPLIPEARIEAMLEAHQASENFFLVSRDASSSKRIKELLVTKGLTFQPARILPNVLIAQNIPGRKQDILDHVLKHEKTTILQDFGSAVVVEAMGVRDGDVIIDACAAPFQKSIAMAWKCRCSGRVIALDVHPGRTSQNLQRLGKRDAHGIHPIIADASSIHMLYRGPVPDKILIDAPCSGSGSLITFPELKDRQTASGVESFAKLQRGIVSSVLQLCQIQHWNNTEIIYSTCSYYPEEGEEIITNFADQIDLLDLHDPVARGASLWQLERGWKGYPCAKYVIRTFPDMDQGSKAFFIAKFKARAK